MDNFRVKPGSKENFRKYKSLCKKYGVPFKSEWTISGHGSSLWYGIDNGVLRCNSSNLWGEELSLGVFEKRLKNRRVTETLEIFQSMELVVGNVYEYDEGNPNSRMYFCGWVDETPVFETFLNRHGISMDIKVEKLGWKSRASGKNLDNIGTWLIQLSTTHIQLQVRDRPNRLTILRLLICISSSESRFAALCEF